MWKLFSDIVCKLEAVHILMVIPIVALAYLVIVLVKMIQKKDEQFSAAFQKKEEQMLAFADKTFAHTQTIARMIDILNVLIGKLK